jgi:hypothetical protein
VFKAKETIQGGATAGTFTAMGGSGAPYAFELLDDGEDSALFEIAGTELKIKGDTSFELPLDVYSVLVRVTDSAGATYQKYCPLQVTLAPAPLRTAPVVYPYMLYYAGTKQETGDNEIKVIWSRAVGADGYKININKASDPLPILSP